MYFKDLIFWMMLVVGSCSVGASQGLSFDPVTPRLDAAEIYSMYRDDPGEAERLFTDRVVILDAKLYQHAEYLFEEKAVIFYVDYDCLYQVTAFFETGRFHAIMDSPPLSRVTIIGRCRGIGRHGRLYFSECALLEDMRRNQAMDRIKNQMRLSRMRSSLLKVYAQELINSPDGDFIEAVINVRNESRVSSGAARIRCFLEDSYHKVLAVETIRLKPFALGPGAEETRSVKFSGTGGQTGEVSFSIEGG
ncbi:MAG: hypothetical protein PHQ23_07295 [Candidatus Wallbacteria bacterium]|nr:hypothetical protein [Candidatus Wallbacteria bacterium]